MKNFIKNLKKFLIVALICIFINLAITTVICLISKNFKIYSNILLYISWAYFIIGGLSVVGSMKNVNQDVRSKYTRSIKATNTSTSSFYSDEMTKRDSSIIFLLKAMLIGLITLGISSLISLLYK